MKNISNFYWSLLKTHRWNCLQSVANRDRESYLTANKKKQLVNDWKAWNRKPNVVEFLCMKSVCFLGDFYFACMVLVICCFTLYKGYTNGFHPMAPMQRGSTPTNQRFMPPYQQQQAFPGMRPMGPGGYSPSPQGQQFYAPHPHAPQHANMPPQSIAGTTQLIIHIY